MKANKAPEKIYIDDFGSELSHDWHTEHCCESDIEYTHTDAFIEKACEWLEPVLKNHAGYYAGEDILGDFRKYMKGE